jgi:hypothetical protein
MLGFALVAACASMMLTQDALEMCIRVCGTESMLYGSDYPHTIGDMIGCLARVDRLAGGTCGRRCAGETPHPSALSLSSPRRTGSNFSTVSL